MPFKIPKRDRDIYGYNPQPPAFTGYPSWEMPVVQPQAPTMGTQRSVNIPYLQSLAKPRTMSNQLNRMGLIQKAEARRKRKYARIFQQPQQGYGLSPSLFGQLVNWRF